MEYVLPTSHLIFISAGLSAVEDAALESALFPDGVAAFLDFEQPEDSAPAAMTQRRRMTGMFLIEILIRSDNLLSFAGYLALFCFRRPAIANRMDGTVAANIMGQSQVVTIAKAMRKNAL